MSRPTAFTVAVAAGVTTTYVLVDLAVTADSTPRKVIKTALMTIAAAYFARLVFHLDTLLFSKPSGWV